MSYSPFSGNGTRMFGNNLPHSQFVPKFQKKVLTAKDEKYILGTVGLFEEAGILLYDEEEGIASFGRFNPYPKSFDVHTTNIHGRDVEMSSENITPLAKTQCINLLIDLYIRMRNAGGTEFAVHVVNVEAPRPIYNTSHTYNLLARQRSNKLKGVIENRVNRWGKKAYSVEYHQGPDGFELDTRKRRLTLIDTLRPL